MTDNTPATTRPGTEIERVEAPISRADTDSWTQVVGTVARLAAEIAGTEFVPRDLRGKPAAVTAAILYGREIGLPPMTALTQTHVIEGKPAASAEAMRALVIAAGHELVVVETTGSVCTMQARRRGSSTWTAITWTLDMARAAGLLSATKTNWANYPRAMLQARCSAELIRLVFPDVVLGMRATEELEDEERPDSSAPADTTVSRAPRKRAEPRRPAAAPTTEARRPADPAPGGMPLPGEEGYVEPARKPGMAPEPDATGAPEPEQAESDQPPADAPPGPTDAEIDAAGVTGHEIILEPGPDGGVRRCRVCGKLNPNPTEACPGPAAEPEAHEEERPKPGPITRAQVRMLNARLGALQDAAGVRLEDTERRGIVRVLAGREEPIESTNQLTKAEGSAVIDTLTRVESLEELYLIVEETVQALRAIDEPDVVDAEIVEEPS